MRFVVEFDEEENRQIGRAANDEIEMLALNPIERLLPSPRGIPFVTAITSAARTLPKVRYSRPMT